MKKTICLLSVLLILLFGGTVFAENTVDTSFFPTNQYHVIQDEFTGDLTIAPKAQSGYFEHSNSGKYKSSITVILNTYDGKPDLDLYIDYEAESWIFADDIMVKIGDEVFTFTNTSIHTEVKSGGVQELLLISLFNARGHEMMEKWIACSGDIRIRLNGQKNFDFTVPVNAKKEIGDFYKLCVDACGLNEQ